MELQKSDRGTERILWHGYENGQPVTFNVEPYTSLWHRFTIGFLRLLPIESQL